MVIVEALISVTMTGCVLTVVRSSLCLVKAILKLHHQMISGSEIKPMTTGHVQTASALCHGLLVSNHGGHEQVCGAMSRCGRHES